MNGLTGDFRFRTDDAGLVILQVQEYGEMNLNYAQTADQWRDARVQDLLDINFCVKQPDNQISAGAIGLGTQGLRGTSD